MGSDGERGEPGASRPRGREVLAVLVALGLGATLALVGWWPPVAPRETPRAAGVRGLLAPGRTRGPAGPIYRPLGELLEDVAPAGPGRSVLALGLLSLWAVAATCLGRAGAGRGGAGLGLLALGVVVHPASALWLHASERLAEPLAGTLVVLACLLAMARRGAPVGNGALVLLALLLAPEAGALLVVLWWSPGPREAPDTYRTSPLVGPLLGALAYLGLRWSVGDELGAGAGAGWAVAYALEGIRGALRGTPPTLASPGAGEALATVALLASAVAVGRERSWLSEPARRALCWVVACGVAAAVIPSGRGILDPARWYLVTTASLAVLGATFLGAAGHGPRLRAAVAALWAVAFVVASREQAGSGERPPAASTPVVEPRTLEDAGRAADRFLEDGEAALSRGDWGEARRQFLDALPTTQRRFRVLQGLAVAAAYQGDVEESIRRTEACRQVDPARTRAEITRFLEAFFSAPERAADGLRFLRSFEVHYEDQWWFHANLSTLSERVGDEEAAARHRRRRAELE